MTTDLADSYRAGLSPHLDDCQRVADPSHVMRVPNRCMDAVRSRVQHAQLDHRGREHDPLYRISKILVAGSERLITGHADRMLLGLRAGDSHDEARRLAGRQDP